MTFVPKTSAAGASGAECLSRSTAGIEGDHREEHLSWIDPECMMISKCVKSVFNLRMCISIKLYRFLQRFIRAYGRIELDCLK